jgi:hypothetical protein
MEKVRHLQISILKDFRTTAIGVRRVTSSDGSKTPGIDGATATTIEERINLAMQVHHSPNFKDLGLHATLNSRVESTALHKLCYSQTHSRAMKKF